MARVTLNWPVGRYALGSEKRKPLPPETGPNIILSRDDITLRRYGLGGTVEVLIREGATADHPVHQVDALYERLAKCKNGKDAEAFANKYGLLRKGDARRALVDEFLSDARSVRELLGCRKRDDWAAAADWMKKMPALDSFTETIGRDESGRYQPEWQPRNLFTFIVDQLLRDWSGSAQYYLCSAPGCGEYFYYGAGTDHRERAPGEPTYCTPRCQSAHAFEKRKQRQRKGKSK